MGLLGGYGKIFLLSRVMALILAVAIASTMLLTSAIGLSSSMLMEYTEKKLAGYSVDAAFLVGYNVTSPGEAYEKYGSGIDLLSSSGYISRSYGSFFMVLRGKPGLSMKARIDKDNTVDDTMTDNTRVILVSCEGVNKTIVMIVPYHVSGFSAYLEVQACSWSYPVKTIDVWIGGKKYTGYPAMLDNPELYLALRKNLGGKGDMYLWSTTLYYALAAAASSLGNRVYGGASVSMHDYLVIAIAPPNRLAGLASELGQGAPIHTSLIASPGSNVLVPPGQVRGGFTAGLWAYTRRYTVYSPEGVYEIGERKLVGSAFSLYFVKYVPYKVLIGASSAASAERYKDAVRRISEMFREKLGGDAWLCGDYVMGAIRDIRYVEGGIQFLFIISLLPSLIVVWIAASRTPPAIITIMRKTIALLRIRGISLGRIKKGFMFASFAWGLLGIVGGIVLGPLMVSLFTGYDYAMLLQVSVDPFTVALVVVLTLVAILISIRSGFRAISNVAPREFTSPTVFTEIQLVKRGMGWWGWFLLGLGAYYVFRSFIGVSPAQLLSQGNISPALAILLIILTLLEPIIVFFGPVILVYAIAKLLTAYPEQLASIVEALVHPFAREYRHVASKLALVKPERISLVILLTSFSISLFLAGVVGAESASVTFDNMVYTAMGPRHIYYVSLPEANTTALNEIRSSVSSALSGTDYTVVFIIPFTSPVYAGSETQAGALVQKGTQTQLPLFYGVFVDDPERYAEVMRIYGSLGVDCDGAAAVRSLRSNEFVYVLPMSMPGEVQQLTEILRSGDTYVVAVSTYSRQYTLSGDMHLHGLLRNLPAVYALGNNVERLEYTVLNNYDRVGVWMNSGIIIATANPGIIATWDTGLGIVERYNATMKRGPYTVVVVFTEEDVGDRLSGLGFTEASTAGDRAYFIGAKQFFRSSFFLNTATGIALTISTLISLAILTFIALEENMFTYTLMRARGVPRKRVFMLAVGESIAMVLIGIIPGVLLGLLLGATIMNIFFSLITTGRGPVAISLSMIYGVSMMITPTPVMIVALIAVPLTVVAVPMIIVKWMYSRILREAIMLLGSHI